MAEYSSVYVLSEVILRTYLFYMHNLNALEMFNVSIACKNINNNIEYDNAF